MQTRPDAVFLERVRDLLGTLGKAQKDYKTYPRNNPILLKRRDELSAKFQAMLGELPELPLSVEADELTFGGESVYKNADKRESIAFHLYRHGVREIRFVAGITIDELDGFIDAVNLDFSGEHLDDDLITVLWSKDLPHFRYDAVDDVDPRIEWVREPEKTLKDYLVSQREMPGNEKFANVIKLEGNQPARDPRADVAAISITAEEVGGIRQILDEDARRDLALQVIEILVRVLKENPDPHEAKNLLRILERVVEISIDQRNFNRAATTLKVLTELAGNQPGLASPIRHTISRFGEPKAVKRLVEVVSSIPPDAVIDELDLFRYLVQLTKAAVVPLAEAMGVVQDRKIRKVFCEALADLTKDDVNLLAGLSRDSRWFVARNVAYILGLTRNPEALKILRGLSVHSNERVRVEAVRASGLLGPGAKDVINRALTDGDRTVRMLAFDLVSAFVQDETPAVLQGLLLDRTFEEKDGPEKRAIAIALARVAGPHALNPLSQVLVRKGSILGSKDESRGAAAAGIAAIGTPDAAAYLRQGAASGDPALSAICLQAMREAKID
jgi:HEAT repeat protein